MLMTPKQQQERIMFHEAGHALLAIECISDQVAEFIGIQVATLNSTAQAGLSEIECVPKTGDRIGGQILLDPPLPLTEDEIKERHLTNQQCYSISIFLAGGIAGERVNHGKNPDNLTLRENVAAQNDLAMIELYMPFAVEANTNIRNCRDEPEKFKRIMISNAWDKLKVKEKQLIRLADHLKTLEGRKCYREEVLRLINE